MPGIDRHTGKPLSGWAHVEALAGGGSRLWLGIYPAGGWSASPPC